MSSPTKTVTFLALWIHGLACPQLLRAGVPLERDTASVWIDRAVASTAALEQTAAHGYASYHLARVRGRAGDAEGALESALRVMDPQRRLYALKYAAEAARAAGDTERQRDIAAAGRMAAASDEGSFTATAFVDLCFASGLPKEVVEYADSVSNPAVRQYVYSRIAGEYCARSDREAAERILRSRIRAGDARDYGRREMVRGMIETGDLETAGQLAGGIRNADIAAQALSDLARAFAKSGDIPKADGFTARVRDRSIRRKLRAEISRISVEGRSLDEVRARFASAQSREERTALLEPLVALLMDAEAFDEADRAVDEVAALIDRDPRPAVSSKFGTYGDEAALAQVRMLQLAVAMELTDRGRSEEAAEILEKAETAIAQLPPEAPLVRRMWELARIRVLLKLGREDDAVKRLREMGPQSESIRSEAAEVIAVHLISSGRIAEAFQVTSRIDDKDDKRSHKGPIASALVVRGEMKQAVRLLNQASESEEAADALRDVARDLTEAGRLSEARELYESLDSPFARAHFAIEIAERLLLADDAAGRR